MVLNLRFICLPRKYGMGYCVFVLRSVYCGWFSHDGLPIMVVIWLFGLCRLADGSLLIERIRRVDFTALLFIDYGE